MLLGWWWWWIGVVCLWYLKTYPSREGVYKALLEQLPCGIQSQWILIPDPAFHMRTLMVHVLVRRPPVAPAKDTPALYFIHGTGSASMRFLEIMKRMGDTHVCVAIDMPGYGISDNPLWYNAPPAKLFNLLGKVVLECIDHITGTLPIVLVGHSFGGFIGLSAMRQAPPSLIQRGILLATPGIFPSLGKYAYYWAYVFRWAIPFCWFKSPLLKWFWYPLLRCLSDPFWARHHCAGDSRHINYVDSFIRIQKGRCIWGLPQISHIMRMHTSLTCVYGEDDTIIPPHQGDVLCRLHSQIRTYVVPKGDHSFIGSPCTLESVLKNELVRKSEWAPRHDVPDVSSNNTLERYSASLSPRDSEKRYMVCYEDLLIYSKVNDYKTTEYPIMQQCDRGLKKKKCCHDVLRFYCQIKDLSLEKKENG